MIDGYSLISACEPRFIRYVADSRLVRALRVVRLLPPPSRQLRIGFAAINEDLIADCYHDEP